MAFTKNQRSDLTEDKIRKSIERKELQLGSDQKIDHYQVPFSLSLVAFFLLILPTHDPISLSFALIPLSLLLISFLYYLILKRRLKFSIIESNLPKSVIEDVLDGICTNLKWDKTINREDIIIFKTPEEFLSPIASEQITILFAQKKIFINSIRNFNAFRKAFGKIGKDAKNIKIITGELKKAEACFKINLLNHETGVFPI